MRTASCCAWATFKPTCLYLLLRPQNRDLPMHHHRPLLLAHLATYNLAFQKGCGPTVAPSS